MLAQVTTGEVRSNAGTCRVWITVHHCRAYPGKTVSIQDASKDGRGLVALQPGSLHSFSAGNGMKPSVVGSWSRANYDLPDGCIVEVSCNKTAPIKAGASLFLRARSAGPMVRISVDLPRWSAAALSTATITGRFDVLETESQREEAQITGDFEVGLASAFRCANRAKYADMIRVEVLERETSPLPRTVVQQVVNSNGERVSTTTTKVSRRLGF